ncbi:putative AP2-like ethylene-responsive transcription factor PLT1 [Iris pallida]|uniref:AP2-like ethylene-responsive transcription factor PLT1 n=1 Tax=Iris pallida TaxID=29817 RepID=A0AAX6H487_IRIPA|nr:putative AP2-like ethylene-responsive transcription factor PLT1 [Iris pallida]
MERIQREGHPCVMVERPRSVTPRTGWPLSIASLPRPEMEEVTKALSNLTVSDTHKKNRIQVSNTKKPLFLYVNLAKRYMQQHNEVELSALVMGMVSSCSTDYDLFLFNMWFEFDEILSSDVVVDVLGFTLNIWFNWGSIV